MPRSRHELERIERQTLAPYAQMSADTRGRRYAESSPAWRTEYQRDRDRVIHSRAFRRLEYKTQVFLNGTGDHLRTRLTHTMEVAAIARGIARALKLNEDLTEAIALAHDLGHSPFGHRGETVLSRLMKGHGGFEHNHHSLRIVEELEQKYPDFPGLNLTWEVREGLVKHFDPAAHPSRRKNFHAKNSSLEAQVANLADEITYYSHDLDDGLDAGLLDERELTRHVRVWAEAARAVKREHSTLPDECRRYFTIRTITDAQVRDVVEHSEELIRKAGVNSADVVRLHPRSLVQYSTERRELNQELRKYLYRNLYFSPQVDEANTRAVRILAELFKCYVAHPREIGEQARKRIRRDGLHRAVCDYLAGMTDRYVMQEHQRLFGLKL
ncbi:MAG: deoxyguanosinetriphosphate triphosphohydrolase [Verrucomicrobia bacterium]|nr:MAG: deoxyguanosinetriphosphate triphosphohydrolase [Verrucomicrobiota bacterium]